jgi:hypothetical protein
VKYDAVRGCFSKHSGVSPPIANRRKKPTRCNGRAFNGGQRVGLTGIPFHRYSLAMRCFALLLILTTGADAPPSPPPVECSPEAMKSYGTKVQPLLANACAACHSTAGCGSFTLQRSTPGATISSTTTQFNLAAAVAQIDKKNPERSKLLVKSITAHGGLRQPPIKDANAAAYKNLEQWVKLMANDGKLPVDPKAPAKEYSDPFDPAIFNNMNKNG